MTTALAVLGCGAENRQDPEDPTQPDELATSDPRDPSLADLRAGLSADAKLETEALLQEDMAAPRSPSDGGGRAWRIASDAIHVAGRRARIEIVFETGPLGIAEGGAIFLQPSPFWEWETPQASLPEAPGFRDWTL